MAVAHRLCHVCAPPPCPADDSEIEKVRGGPKIKTRFTGFYINKVRRQASSLGQTNVCNLLTQPRYLLGWWRLLLLAAGATGASS